MAQPAVMDRVALYTDVIDGLLRASYSMQVLGLKGDLKLLSEIRGRAREGLIRAIIEREPRTT